MLAASAGQTDSVGRADECRLLVVHDVQLDSAQARTITAATAGRGQRIARSCPMTTWEEAFHLVQGVRALCGRGIGSQDAAANRR